MMICQMIGTKRLYDFVVLHVERAEEVTGEGRRPTLRTGISDGTTCYDETPRDGVHA